MSIVFVCNAKLDIVWIDHNFCKTVDCTQHAALGSSLFDFLDVPAGDPFRAEVRALGDEADRTTYGASFRAADGRVLPFTFYIELVPSFEGVDGAALISVGVQAASPAVLEAIGADAAERLGTSDPMRRTYRYSNLRLEDGARLYSRLERLIEGEELYRDRGLTLETAAGRLSTNALYISQVINFFSGYSFPNYLNTKRLERLERRLRQNPAADFTEAWQEAGFGSYSSLNRFLRTVRGTSPSKFSKAARSSVRERDEGEDGLDPPEDGAEAHSR